MVGLLGCKREVVNFMLKRYAKMAGLSEMVSLHWLHHTKITLTAKDKKVRVSDEMAKKLFRWGSSSRMFSRYTHLHGTDSKETFLALAGVKEIEEEETVVVLTVLASFSLLDTPPSIPGSFPPVVISQ